MRYDNNGQPMGYGDPMDPLMYGQADPAWAQYQQQGAYQGGMPSPQDIYAQQQYMDPNQMYMDPNQGMYGAQPMADPYGQYAAQGMYPEQDPMMGAQQPYMDQDPQFQQAAQGYGQPQQAYPAAQQAPSYGQMQQPMPQQTQPMMAQPMPQQAPQAQPQPEPVQAAQGKQKGAKQASVPVGPEPPASKATLCMILGILSVIFALIPPIGLILGFVVRKMSQGYAAQGGTSPKAETGRIFATVGIVFGFIMLAVFVFMGIFIYAGLYGEGQARVWSVFFNNSPFGNIWRIPIPNPLS